MEFSCAEIRAPSSLLRGGERSGNFCWNRSRFAFSRDSIDVKVTPLTAETRRNSNHADAGRNVRAVKIDVDLSKSETDDAAIGRREKGQLKLKESSPVFRLDFMRRLRFRNIPNAEEPDERITEIDASAEFGFVQ